MQWYFICIQHILFKIELQNPTFVVNLNHIFPVVFHCKTTQQQRDVHRNLHKGLSLSCPLLALLQQIGPAGVHVENGEEKLQPDKSNHTRHRLFCLFLSLQGLEWLSCPILSSFCVECGGPTPTRSSTCHCKSVFSAAADGNIKYTYHHHPLKHAGVSNQNSETKLGFKSYCD